MELSWTAKKGDIGDDDDLTMRMIMIEPQWRAWEREWKYASQLKLRGAPLQRPSCEIHGFFEEINIHIPSPHFHANITRPEFENWVWEKYDYIWEGWMFVLGCIRMYRLVKEAGMELGVLITKKFNQVGVLITKKFNQVNQQLSRKPPYFQYFDVLYITHWIRTSGPLVTSLHILNPRA